ncbi:aminotransferase class IV [Spirosoma koreense]
MFLVYNSDVLAESAFQLSLTDRAFQYGDGLFETIRYENGQIWFWPDHFARLSAGMKALQLNPLHEFSAEALHQRILQLLSANELTNRPARIKIQIWRQPGGLYTPVQNEANLLISARPGAVFSISEKSSAGLYEAFRLSFSPVSRFKTLNALPYILAGLYKQQQHLDEVILLDTGGHLAECLASNLFWWSGQTLYTPSLHTGCIDGILRQQLLRVAPKLGIEIVQGLYSPEVLLQAEAVFCANVMGIQWLRMMGTAKIGPGSWGPPEQLLDALFAQIHG